MRPSTLVLLPDQFSDPIRVIRVDDAGLKDDRYASLTEIRTGEDRADHPSIRRYEISEHITHHITDLVNARVVITDSNLVTKTERLCAPSRARRHTALHPDRHDLATWLRAANLDSEAPWVSHLAVAVRDAMRDLGDNYPAIIVCPDRAYLAASEDNTQPAIQALLDTFTTPAHEIDPLGHRTGRRLAPMPISKVCECGNRSGIITRAQAVTAEALLNAVDGEPRLSNEDILNRWTTIVGDDHLPRLRRGADGCYSAPVAILDDHNDSRYTATLSLSTMKIAIGHAASDIWFDYHHAYDIDASRPFDINVAMNSLLRLPELTEDQEDMLAVLREHALPVLELSTTPSGEFANRHLISSIPDSSPLLCVHPGFNFPDAILAYLMLREPEAFANWRSKPFEGLSNDIRPNGRAEQQGDEQYTLEGSGHSNRLVTPIGDGQAKAVATTLNSEAIHDGDIDDIGAGIGQMVVRPNNSLGEDGRTDTEIDGCDFEDKESSETVDFDTVAGVMAALTDTDQAVVDMIQTKVQSNRIASIAPVPSDDKLRTALAQRPDFLERVWAQLREHFKTVEHKRDDNVQRCLFSEEAWLSYLFLLNLNHELVINGVKSSKFATKDFARSAAASSLNQCDLAEVEPLANRLKIKGNGMGGSVA